MSISISWSGFMTKWFTIQDIFKEALHLKTSQLSTMMDHENLKN